MTSPLPVVLNRSLIMSAPGEINDIPTQEGPKGIRFDFNDGCRVLLPESDHPWRLRLSDLDTGNVLYETEIKAGRVNSAKSTSPISPGGVAAERTVDLPRL